MSLIAGMGRRCVDVPEGTALSGYTARSGRATGVHDPLTVTALALDASLLVTVDICIIHERTSDEIRRRLRAANVRFEVCVIACTHTHSGPAVAFDRLGRHDAGLHEQMVSAAVEAASDAWAARTTCHVHTASVRGLGLAVNRRHPERLVDPPLHIVRFVRADGSVLGHLLSHACHPVILDATNQLVSADFPGSIRTHVEDAFPGSLTLWLPGCAGDLNPRQAGTPADDMVGQGGDMRTFAEVERAGQEFAARVRTAAVEPVVAESVPTASALLNLTTGAAPHLTSWAAPVTVLRLGAVWLCCLPGEPFLATAERLAQVLPGTVIATGYCDDVAGYLPPNDEYAHGGYEVAEAHLYYGLPGAFTPGTAEQIEDAVVRLADSL